MSEVLVIGHRNPDTDAICSALGYAEFKRRTGMPHAVAARCGDTNERIDFVLKRFGVAAPKFVADVSPRIRDVMSSDVVSLPPNATISEALGLMDERNIRVLPIVNPDGTCRGLLSVFKASRFFFPAGNRPFDSRRVLASLRGLTRTLGAKMFFATDPDKMEDLILMVGAMSLESFSKRLAGYPREKLVVVVGDRDDIQELAVQERVRVVVVTGGFPVSEKIGAMARKNEVGLISSPHDSATTAMLCRGSITVDQMMHEHFLSFPEDEMLDSARRIATESRFLAFPVVDCNGKMVGIFTKTEFLRKVDRQLILVDHNELTQAVVGADKVEIIEIIDHHRIGSLSTQQPILFRNEPVGSTSTIVADCFFRYNVEMPKAIAGLLLAGLVSDTLNLTSPTTTEQDMDILQKLEAISGEDATEFTEKLFESGSVLISRTAAEAITTDCKEYVEQGKRFSVAQIEEIGFDRFLKRKEQVFAALEDYRMSNGYFFSALMVTDVVAQDSLLLVAGDEGFVRKINHPKVEPGIFETKGVVSRKKQLLPFLTECLAMG